MQSPNIIASTTNGKNRWQQPKPFANFLSSKKFSLPEISSAPVLSMPKMQTPTKSPGKEVNASKSLPTSSPPPMELFVPPYQDAQWWSSMSTIKGNEQPKVQPQTKSAPEKPSGRWNIPSLPKVSLRPSAAGTKKDEGASLYKGNLRGIRSGIMSSSDRKQMELLEAKPKPQKPETKPKLEQPELKSNPQPETESNPQPEMEHLILEQQELIQQFCVHQDNLVLEHRKAITLHKKFKSIIAEQEKVIATQKMCCAEQQAVIDEQCQRIVKQKKELDALRRSPQPTIVDIPPREAVRCPSAASDISKDGIASVKETNSGATENHKDQTSGLEKRISCSADDADSVGDAELVIFSRHTVTPEYRKESASVIDGEGLDGEDGKSCSSSDVGLSLPKPTLKRVASKAA